MMAQTPDTPIEPLSGPDFDLPDDRYVPVRFNELVEVLASNPAVFGTQSGRLKDVARAFQCVICQEAVRFELGLCDRYSAFNPDRDTVPTKNLDTQRTPDGYRELFRRIGYLLEKANFERLTPAQVETAVKMANTYGLRVVIRADRIASLDLWVRGQRSGEHRRRTLGAPIRGKVRSLPVYRRFVVSARLRDDPHVMLKLFKDIPISDVEALLPHAELSMSWIDRAKVLGGGAGVLGSTTMKVVNIGLTAAAVSKLLWVFMFGSGVLAVRAFMGYRSARVRRDSVRTRHLYYQNLNNNMGVIHSLIQMTSEEECKEAFLAWAFCRAAKERSADSPFGGPIKSETDLRARIERCILERFEIPVRFDIKDALETITRLDLWSGRNAFHVLGPDDVITRLDAHWHERRSEDYHEQMAHACPEHDDARPIENE